MPTDEKIMLAKFKDIRVAVIVALAEEYDIFCKYFHGEVVEKFHVGNLILNILQRTGGTERIGLVSINRMGNVAAAVAAARLLEVFDLDLVANLGIAAGVDTQKQTLGDIVVADTIRYYETGKRKAAYFDVSPQYSDLRSSFLDRIQTANVGDWPLGTSIGGYPRRVFFGTVASGEKVIADSDFVHSLLLQDRKTIGIEMESYGIAAAVYGRNEKLLLIRGICDFADEQKNDSARLSAMEGAVLFFNEAMNRGLFGSPAPAIVRPRPDVFPDTYSIYLAHREVREGVPHSYINIQRVERLNEFKYRRSVIKKFADRFTMGDLRSFCTSLKVDFDEIRGETKTEKVAGLIDVVERQKILTIEDLESLIDLE